MQIILPYLFKSFQIFSTLLENVVTLHRERKKVCSEIQRNLNEERAKPARRINKHLKPRKTQKTMNDELNNDHRFNGPTKFTIYDLCTIQQFKHLHLYLAAFPPLLQERSGERVGERLKIESLKLRVSSASRKCRVQTDSKHSTPN